MKDKIINFYKENKDKIISAFKDNKTKAIEFYKNNKQTTNLVFCGILCLFLGYSKGKSDALKKIISKTSFLNLSIKDKENARKRFSIESN